MRERSCLSLCCLSTLEDKENALDVDILSCSQTPLHQTRNNARLSPHSPSFNSSYPRLYRNNNNILIPINDLPHPPPLYRRILHHLHNLLPRLHYHPPPHRQHLIPVPEIKHHRKRIIIGHRTLPSRSMATLVIRILPVHLPVIGSVYHE